MIPDDEHKRMTEAGYTYVSIETAVSHKRIIKARVASDGFGVWIRTRDMRHQPDRSGTCRHARQVQQKWEINADTRNLEAWTPHPDEYTCGYLDQFTLPPAVARWTHGLDIRTGDCESCPLYETPELPEALKG